jgi:hypothetical protein
VVTFDVSHDPTGWLNTEQLTKVEPMLVALDVSHPLMFWLNTEQPLNVAEMLVTLPTDQPTTAGELKVVDP